MCSGRPSPETLRLRAAPQAIGWRGLSDRLSRQVAWPFAAAGPLPFGNAFSNANRAGDHILAWGSSWPSAPAPLTVSGHPLPRDLLAAAADSLARHPGILERGYMAR